MLAKLSGKMVYTLVILLWPIEDRPGDGKSAISSENSNLSCFLHILDNFEHSHCYNILMVKVDEGLTTHTSLRG